SIAWYFFFFSSRRRHTRSDRDWSSDVCSSDLSGRRRVVGLGFLGGMGARLEPCHRGVTPCGKESPTRLLVASRRRHPGDGGDDRSEERRVGKEWRTQWPTVC